MIDNVTQTLFPNWVRKGSEQDEHHNKSARTDNCSSGSGPVLWAALQCVSQEPTSPMTLTS